MKILLKKRISKNPT